MGYWYEEGSFVSVFLIVIVYPLVLFCLDDKKVDN